MAARVCTVQVGGLGGGEELVGGVLVAGLAGVAIVAGGVPATPWKRSAANAASVPAVRRRKPRRSMKCCIIDPLKTNNATVGRGNKETG